MGFEEDVRNALQKAVEEAGSLNALAVKCGMNQATIYRWLNGSRDPALSGVSKVMDFLNMTVVRRGSVVLPPMGEPKGVAASILESQKLALEKARLEGQVEVLKELLGSNSKKEKSVG